VYGAETQAELRAATADLPDLRRPPPRPEGRHLAPSTSVNLIGDSKISGWLAVDGDILVISVIGDVLIDLSTAEIPAEGVSITAVGVIGDIKVILPDGVRVQPQAFSLIGTTKTALSPPLPGQPTIRVRGVQVIGDAAVYSLSEVPEGPLRRLWAKLRGDSARD
ncbi:MAG: LiaF domain-containing protein, partial [Acidimicrobiales bacterium]